MDINRDKAAISTCATLLRNVDIGDANNETLLERQNKEAPMVPESKLEVGSAVSRKIEMETIIATQIVPTTGKMAVEVISVVVDESSDPYCNRPTTTYVLEYIQSFIKSWKSPYWIFYARK